VTPGPGTRFRPRDETLDPFWAGLWLWIAFLAILGATALVSGKTPASRAMAELVAHGLMAAALAVCAWAGRSVLYRPASEPGLTSLRSLVLTVGAWIMIFLFMSAYVRTAEALGFRYLDLGERYTAAGWPRWAVLAEVALVPALIEEIAFRGLIQGGLGRVMKTRDALIVQAAMFSVLHFSPVCFVSHFVIGLILGALRQQTRSLYPGMLVHAAWNAWVVS
jgi:membrane protease YdiL (CAAX protease family)